MSLAIIGSGAFGTALATAYARKTDVCLWSRSPGQVADIEKSRRNTVRLPGFDLAPNIAATTDMIRATQHDLLLLAVPMQELRGLLTEHGALFTDKTLVACCKGVELGTGLGPVALLRELVPDATVGLLTGPSFAEEIARGLPTALTLACSDSDVCQGLQMRLSTETIRVYRTTDTIGAELGGALKNVIAIACGAVMGAGLGHSARAALMTRGYAEMLRLVLDLGGQPETLAGLSGFGDLVLTCSSEQSRNFRLGVSIGRAIPFDPGVTVEGAATAKAVAKLAVARGIDMPITGAVAALVEQKQSLNQVISQLLARSLKEE